MTHLFVYGTLMFEPVSRTLAGPHSLGIPAKLPGYARYEATLQPTVNFPFIEPLSDQFEGASPKQYVEGILIRNISPLQLAAFDWFEGEGDWYLRQPVKQLQVKDLATGQFRASEIVVETYVAGQTLLDALECYASNLGASFESQPWDAASFEQHHVMNYFQNTVLPTIEDPSFQKRFAALMDWGYVNQLKNRLEDPS